MNQQEIYLDYNSTTPIDDRVLELMLPYFKEHFGNPSSGHKFGQNTNKAIKQARQQVADLINANSKEIIFNSGATEAINLALKGIALAPTNTKRHIVTVQTEHKAVLDTCKFLETLGFEVSYLPVQTDGILDPIVFKRSLRADTLMACVMLVNNETGVIQDVHALCEYCKAANVIFMSDATQAVGKMPLDVHELGIDLLAFSGHKFYGPKGIGALYISKEIQTQNYLQPLIHGGGHENGIRSGTLNATSIIGFGKACEIATQEMKSNEDLVRKLRDELEKKLLEINGAFVNGNISKRIFNTTNICFPDIDANILIAQLKNISVSNGSACSSAVVEPSHVLKAIGLTENQSFSSIRFSLGKYNSNSEIQLALKEIVSKIKSLQSKTV